MTRENAPLPRDKRNKGDRNEGITTLFFYWRTIGNKWQCPGAAFVKLHKKLYKII